MKVSIQTFKLLRITYQH